jgi:hypothetical protein
LSGPGLTGLRRAARLLFLVLARGDLAIGFEILKK